MSLHEFFVGWFTGALDDAEPFFDRFADALHPEFTMIVPTGELLDRDAVVASVRAGHGTAIASFAIEIGDVVERIVSDDAVVVTYEERQYVGDRVDSRRASTAVFVRSPRAVNGVRWRHLHETLQPI